MSISRRTFIKNAGILSSAIPFISPLRACSPLDATDQLEIHLFSKHLQFLDVPNAAAMAAEIGFDGLDLTVRPKGHILPENVTTELPTAIQKIKNAGSSCKMMTTAVSDVANPLDVDVIKTAASHGIQYYRSNWFKFKEDLTLEASLDYYKEKVQQLGELNRTHNIEYFGAQYDIRHAVAEGGRSWSNGVKLIRDNIKTIVLKDFKWGQVNGKWKIINVPIGEGMVDFDAYFKLLKSLAVKVPVSLHLEYPLGGAEKGKSEITVDEKVVYEAMRKDLALIQKLWKEA